MFVFVEGCVRFPFQHVKSVQLADLKSASRWGWNWKVSVFIHFSLLCSKANRKSALKAIREDRTRGGRSTYQCSYVIPSCVSGASSSPVPTSLDPLAGNDYDSMEASPTQDSGDHCEFLINQYAGCEGKCHLAYWCFAFDSLPTMTIWLLLFCLRRFAYKLIGRQIVGPVIPTGLDQVNRWIAIGKKAVGEMSCRRIVVGKMM